MFVLYIERMLSDFIIWGFNQIIIIIIKWKERKKKKNKNKNEET